MNELELLKGAQNNDQQAFKEIFKRYKGPIFYMIYQMVNNTTVAEDLMMETFEKAFREIKTFVPKYKLIAWIIKIGKNKTLDYIRSQNIRPRYTELDYMIPDHWNPEKELIGKEQAQILETAITHLNGNYRKVITMWIEGKKCKEIAEELNIPINTVTGYTKVSRKKMLIEQSKVGRIKVKKDETPSPLEKSKIVFSSKKIREKRQQRERYEKFKEKYREYQNTYRKNKRNERLPKIETDS